MSRRGLQPLGVVASSFWISKSFHLLYPKKSIYRKNYTLPVLGRKAAISWLLNPLNGAHNSHCQGNIILSVGLKNPLIGSQNSLSPREVEHLFKAS